MLECECKTWARDGRLPFTHHHPNCKHNSDLAEVVVLARRMLKHFVHECAQGDGIPDSAWNDYVAAEWMLNGNIIGDPSHA